MALTIKEALVAFLKTDAGITALAGTRIYPKVIPQDVTGTALAYTRVSSTRVLSFLGPSGLATARFQLDCQGYGQTAEKDAETLAEAVRTASGGTAAFAYDQSGGSRTKHLDGFKGWMGPAAALGVGVNVEACLLADRRDSLVPDPHSGERDTHRVSLDFMIWYDESV